MSTEAELEGANRRIEERLAELDPDDPRAQLLMRSLEYRNAWLVLGGQLHSVKTTKMFREWGFGNLNQYIEEDLELPRNEVGKMLRAFEWVEREAPEFIPESAPEMRWENPPRPVPDVDTVTMLRSAEREVEKERVDADFYQEFKQRALEGNTPLKELKQELKAQIPVNMDPDFELLKTLRRSASAAERIVEGLSETGDMDEMILDHAVQLRDGLRAILESKTQSEAEEA